MLLRSVQFPSELVLVDWKACSTYGVARTTAIQPPSSSRWFRRVLLDSCTLGRRVWANIGDAKSSDVRFVHVDAQVMDGDSCAFFYTLSNPTRWSAKRCEKKEEIPNSETERSSERRMSDLRDAAKRKVRDARRSVHGSNMHCNVDLSAEDARNGPRWTRKMRRPWRRRSVFRRHRKLVLFRCVSCCSSHEPPRGLDRSLGKALHIKCLEQWKLASSTTRASQPRSRRVEAASSPFVCNARG